MTIVRYICTNKFVWEVEIFGGILFTGKEMEIMKKSSLKKMFSCILAASMIFSGITMVNAADAIEMIGTNSANSRDSSRWWQSIGSASLSNEVAEDADANVIIDPSMKYQDYAGIGISLDETSVSNLWKLGLKEDGTYDMWKIENAIRMLVNPEDGAGFELFRITIGSPDCIEHIPFWSYDDMPLMEEGCAVDPETGECPCGKQHEDWDLEYFSIQKDIDYHIVETAQLILKHNPDAKFFASAWSAPAWMTTTGTFVGWPNLEDNDKNDSKLRDECIDVFARYYAKFIQAYEEQGIPVYAITELNEPGMSVPYPSMHLSVEQQQKLAIAIKKVFKEEGIDAELWGHDFNFWDWKYPEAPDSTEYKNHHKMFEEGELAAATEEAVDGIAFHPYWGNADMMKQANEETGKPVYLTEAGGMDPGTILSYFRLNCSSYTGWTMITDQDGGTLHWNDNKNLHIREDDIESWTEIGQSSGAKWRNRLVTVNTESQTISYASYLGCLGQMSKYIDEGATRVYSSDSSNGITNAVYVNPSDNDSEEYVIVFNNTGDEKTVNVNIAGKTANVKVPSGFTTYTWVMPKLSAENNHAPEFKEVENIVVKQFDPMTLQLEATDQDNNALTYYAVDVPAGVEVDAKTGLITWTPGTAGDFTFKFAVTDGIQNTQIEVNLTVEEAPVPLPNRIQANVSNIKDGDSSSFAVDAKEAGTYMLLINYTTNNIWSISNQGITVLVDDVEVDSKKLAVTWSGSGAVKLPIQLEKGIHDLKLVYSDTGYTVNYLDISNEMIHRIPAKVEAEDYNNSFGVNFEPRGRGYNVSETNPEDWLEYKIVSPVDAEFEIIANYGNEKDATLDIYVDGEKVDKVLNLPATGAWGTYRDSEPTSINLTKGEHTVRFVISSETGANIDYFTYSTDTPILVDKSELETSIQTAEAINLDEYISTNKDAFTEALEQAKSIYANDEATLEEVNNATNALNSAMENLIRVADKTALKDAIDKAEGINLDKYIDNEAKTSLADTLASAKAVYDDADVLQADVNTQTENLLNVLNGLVEKVDKTELNEVLGEMTGIDLSLYEEESTVALKEAIETAKTVMNDETATSEDVENAISLLKDAKEQLVLKEVPDLDDPNNEKPGVDEPTIEDHPKDEDKDNGDKNEVDTSDNTNIMPYILFAGISSLGLIAFLKKRKEVD